MARFFARRLAPWASAGAIVLCAAPQPAQGAEPHAPGSRDVAKASPRTGKPRGLEGARRAIAGGPLAEDVAAGPESPDLRALREAERELFPTASPAPGTPWPTDFPALQPGDRAPHVLATGLPPSAPPAPPPSEDLSLAWLNRLELPDVPVRWDDRVVRYLLYFRDDPRGHATFANLYRHSGRWAGAMRRILRAKSEPEDLVWVAMIESGFDPVARSSAGAAGLWQFMPETAKIYGLSVDRWLDQRLGALTASRAAADFLGDLHRRFGSWELALAAFNMGYVGLSSVVRRYNTNDFWSLARTEGTLPWETTLYVPKVLAAAVVAHNLAAFGFADVVTDPPVEGDDVEVPPGTALAAVALGCGATSKEIELLNPELRAARTPPDAPYTVKVPLGKGPAAGLAVDRLRHEPVRTERYVVRFGETLDQIAAARRTTTQKLVEMNAIAPGEALRGGTVLLVPKLGSAEGAAGTSGGSGPLGAGGPPGSGASPGGGTGVSPTGSGGGATAKPNVVVPADLFVYPDRRRVFYRALVGDTLQDIAAALHVFADDLRRWNDLDPGARLQEGMTLQAFVPKDADLGRVIVSTDADVHVLPVGSDEFFAALERDKGFRRVTVVAKSGDTIESIGRRYDVSARTMERINRRPRGEALAAGDSVVVYVPADRTRFGGRSLAQIAPASFGRWPSLAALPPLTPPVPDLP